MYMNQSYTMFNIVIDTGVAQKSNPTFYHFEFS